MNHTRQRGLIALNAALLLVLGLVTLGPRAGAQSAIARAPGNYTMVGGRINGGNSNAVWIIDGTNQELIAVRWDTSRSTLTGIGFRDIVADGNDRAGSR